MHHSQGLTAYLIAEPDKMEKPKLASSLYYVLWQFIIKRIR